MYNCADLYDCLLARKKFDFRRRWTNNEFFYLKKIISKKHNTHIHTKYLAHIHIHTYTNHNSSKKLILGETEEMVIFYVLTTGK